MTTQDDNRETPPAVEPGRFEGLPKEQQRRIQRTHLLTIVLGIIFVVIVIFFLTR